MSLFLSERSVIVKNKQGSLGRSPKELPFPMPPSDDTFLLFSPLDLRLGLKIYRKMTISCADIIYHYPFSIYNAGITNLGDHFPSDSHGIPFREENFRCPSMEIAG